MRHRSSQSILGSVIQPSHWLFYITVVVSLGLHGVLLRAPLPEARSRPEPEEPETAEIDTIKILSLGGLETTEPAPTVGATPTQPQAAPSPSPEPTPEPSPAPQSLPSPTAPPPAPAPSPEAPAPPTPVPSPATPSEPTQNEQAPATPPSTPASPAPNPTPPAQDTFPDISYPGAAMGANDFFDDPKLEAKAQNTNHSIDQIVNYYQQDAPNRQDFRLEAQHKNSSIQAFKVIAQGHQPKYLHIFEHDGIRIISAADDLLTAEDFEDQQRLAQMTLTQRDLENKLVDANTAGTLEWNEVSAKLPSHWRSKPQDVFVLRGKVTQDEATNLAQALEQEFFALQIPGSDIHMITNSVDQHWSVQVSLIDLGDGTVGVVSLY